MVLRTYHDRLLPMASVECFTKGHAIAALRAIVHAVCLEESRWRASLDPLALPLLQRRFSRVTPHSYSGAHA